MTIATTNSADREERSQIRARYTGQRAICYRWLGAVNGGEIVAAQNYPGAEIVGVDTFQSVPDGGVATYRAGILLPGTGASTIDWSGARHIEFRRELATVGGDPKGPRVGVHYVDVAGKRGRYVCA